MSRGDASGSEHDLEPVVAVVRRGRGSQDVAERPTDGGREGHVVRPDVVQPLTRREAVAQHQPATVGQRGKQRGVQRVAVCQRQRAVQDAPSVRSPCPTRHRANRAWLHFAAFGADVEPDVKSRNSSVDGGGSESGGAAPAKSAQGASATRTGSSMRSAEGGIGDDELACRVVDVAGKLRAAARRVHPDDAGTCQRRPEDLEDVLGHRRQQHADVRRPVRVERRAHPRCPRCGLGDDLPPGPRPVPEDEPDVVVVGPAPDQGGHRRGPLPARRRHADPLRLVTATHR